MKKKLALGLVFMLALGLLPGCSKPAQDKGPTYKDGTYEGVGKGYKSDIKAKVEVKDGKISNIEILEQEETPGLGDNATKDVADKIVKEQTTEVEGVSGATGSSNGTKEAVKNALDKAK